MCTARDVDPAQGRERIVKAALAELPPSGSVLLGPGAVAERLAEVLPSDRPLTVFTNAPAIAQTLAGRVSTPVVLIGGRLDRHHGAAVDAWALDSLARLRVAVAFVVPEGVSVQRGLTAPGLAGAAVQAAMIAAARRTVLLVDHAAIGAAHMARFGGIADVAVMITDADLDDDTTAAIASRGPRVVRV